jgi:alpha-tubulin suppressor-like RCC1 family protein
MHHTAMVFGWIALAMTAGCGVVAGIEDKEYNACAGTCAAGKRCTSLGECVAPRLSALSCTTCATRIDGSVWCWGDGFFGQLGPAHVENRENNGTPVRVELPEPAVDVSVGGAHVCAVTDSRKVYCWGWNAGAQCTLPPTEDLLGSVVPSLVSDLPDVLSVSAGMLHTCALTVGGEVYCWGSNHAGQCGVKPNHNFPPKPNSKLDCFDRDYILSNRQGLTLPPTRVRKDGAPILGVKQLMVQKNTSCALFDSALYCWGSNCGDGDSLDGVLGGRCTKGGQLGIPPSDVCYESSPRKIDGLPAFVVTTFGLGHFSGFAADTEGKLYGWGWGGEQLGLAPDNMEFKAPFLQILRDTDSPLKGVSAVAKTNGWHQFVKVGSDFFSWGQNTCGELALTSDKNASGTMNLKASRAEQVPAGATALATGQDHTCFMNNGGVYCLGHERYVGLARDAPTLCTGEHSGNCPNSVLQATQVEFP